MTFPALDVYASCYVFFSSHAERVLVVILLVLFVRQLVGLVLDLENILTHPV